MTLCSSYRELVKTRTGCPDPGTTCLKLVRKQVALLPRGPIESSATLRRPTLCHGFMLWPKVLPGLRPEELPWPTLLGIDLSSAAFRMRVEQTDSREVSSMKMIVL